MLDIATHRDFYSAFEQGIDRRKLAPASRFTESKKPAARATGFSQEGASI
jgi:hypothetical protein